MSSEPPLPPDPSQPRYPSFLPPERERALGGDVAIKVLAVSAALSSVGFGLCSLAALSVQGRSRGSIFIPIGASGFFIGLLGIVVSLVWLLLSVIADWNER